MDNNIAFSSFEAVRLNECLQKSLSEHLFLTCNYDPDTMFVPINEDAKFILAVNNMYKFLVDAGICNYLQGSFGIDFKRLYRINEIIQYINALRTVFAHNVNQINGTVKECELVEKWCLDITGKKLVDTEKEYKKVLVGVRDFGKESVHILTDFIKYVSGLPDNKKRQIIKEWEKLIIKFYKRPNSRNILEGQLVMYYRSQVSGVNSREKMYIAETVKNMMTYKKDIDDLQNILAYLNRVASGRQNSNLNKKINEIENKIKELEDKKEVNNEIIKRFVRKKNCSWMFAYYDYYLEEKLLETIEYKILNNSSNTSLLPQDIVLETIKEDFENVEVYT